MTSRLTSNAYQWPSAAWKSQFRRKLLDWYKQGSGPTSNAGIFELYRQRAEELRRGESARQRRVRLRVPQGIGRMNLLHLNVAADGTCEMPESEAESFLRAGWVRVHTGD